jgi:hypothetical protein
VAVGPRDAKRIAPDGFNPLRTDFLWHALWIKFRFLRPLIDAVGAAAMQSQIAHRVERVMPVVPNNAEQSITQLF